MLELKNITAGYGRHTVLEDLTAGFEKGKLTCIIGVNGSGKSTLLRACLGLLPVKKGEISLDGTALEALSREDIAKRVSYLLQGNTTPDMTVEQLVLHGRFPHLRYPRRYTGKDRQIALQAMERLGIGDLANAPLQTLSGGLRQMACIAMALAQDTDYILLDEPTAYLDIAHQLALLRTLRGLADRGKGVVAVMHDLPVAFTFADRILLLREGRVAGNAPPAQLCRGNVLEETFGVGLVPTPDGKSYHYSLFQ